MSSFNRVVLLGNLTREVEIRHTTGGTAVCDLGLAVNDRVKKGDEWVDEPTFVDCTAFGRTAEIASEYLAKGSPLLLEGRLKLDQWTDKESGAKRSKLKVVVDRIQLIGGKRGTDSDDPPKRQRQQAASRPSESFYEQAVDAGFKPSEIDPSSIPF